MAINVDRSASPTKENAGIPTPILLVKPYRAVVLDGEDIRRVAMRFAGDRDKWRELMAANTGVLKPGRIPEGESVAVPASLEVGTRLFIPASWPDMPNASGEQIPMAGAANINLGDWLGMALGTIAATANGRAPNDPPDVGAPWPDIGKVVIAWWPYLATQPGAPPVPPVTSITTITSKEVVDYILALIASAVRFLEAGGTTSAAVQVPWAAVPWGQVPWNAIAQEFPGAESEFWSFFRRATAPPVQFSPAPVGGADFVNIPGFSVKPGAGGQEPPQWPDMSPSSPASGGQAYYPFDPRRNAGSQPAPQGGQNLRPPRANTGVLEAGGTPINLAQADWAGEYTNVNWTEVPWGSIFWSAFTDGEVVKCSASNPGRLRVMWDCAECFENQGVDYFKAVLCDITANPCACKVTPQPGTPGTGTPGTGTPPTAMPNWTCTPFPDCLSQPGNWPQGLAKPCPPPGAAFPACVPEWIRSQGGQVPGQQPEKPKPDNTVWWVLGGGAALFFVIGVVAVTAARS